MKRIIAVGEPLIEFTQSDGDRSAFRRGIGGDTVNTAIYLARLLGTGTVSYLTRLGCDAQSEWILQTLKAEGVRCDLIRQSEAGVPGLSMIECDHSGERSFTYWRSQSPARSLFTEDFGEDRALDAAKGLFVSAVTFAIICPSARERLLEVMQRARRRGAPVWFDLNFRPQLWGSLERARRTIGDAIGIASTVLPSFDDVVALWDAKTPEAGMEVLAAFGCSNILMKTGGGPVYHSTPQGMTETPLSRISRPVDTTGAGDSFNAGYIAALSRGRTADEAIATGHRLASRVVMHKGAVIDRAMMPDLTALA